MNIKKMAACLGLSENSTEFLSVMAEIKELPLISEDPISYNDPEGRTKYYSFPSSGILFGFRSEKLDHVHIFAVPHEGYASYSHELLDSLSISSTERDIVASLGSPERSGGGSFDKLIGYIHKWMRYSVEDYKVRFELMESCELRKVTLKNK
ncbi:hypothetical protein NHH82_20900 [Oxalobacteraceae bacterium OTU3REALA1]|nr:hypothetical protein NHH82_20900 [Oxalobacteraceae bacterium OTU3REALA1]